MHHIITKLILNAARSIHEKMFAHKLIETQFNFGSYFSDKSEEVDNFKIKTKVLEAKIVVLVNELTMTVEHECKR